MYGSYGESLTGVGDEEEMDAKDKQMLGQRDDTIVASEGPGMRPTTQMFSGRKRTSGGRLRQAK